MADFDDLDQSAADAVFDAFGCDATYTPKGGSPIACRVIIDRDDETVPDDQRGLLGRAVVVVAVRTSEVTKPERDDLFTITGSGEILEVNKRRSNDGVVAEVDVK